MKVAISAEEPLFRQNRILVTGWAKKYPGASWLPLLRQYLCGECEVVTADVAFDHVKYGYLKSEDVIVIQHGSDPIAHALIESGALPLVLTCFESPLYIGEFYNNISSIASIFKYRILFSGLHNRYESKFGTNYQVTFPSYYLENIGKYHSDWDERKFIVAVIGNKYVVPACCPSLYRPLEFSWWIRKKIAQLVFGTLSKNSFPVKDLQLQDMRLEYISFFMSHGLLDLYGKGWDSLRNLPPRWQKKLAILLEGNSVNPCENKLETIKNYKYGLCIENAKLPGYVTEKIIDCLVSKVIPVYMGAPDIEKYIPKTCFININDFNTPDDLLNYLKSISYSDARLMIDSGQEFLLSDKGKQYSYEGFSHFIANLVIKECEGIT